MLETGLHFQVEGGQFDVGLKNNQILSVSYISTNVYYCFINNIYFSLGNMPIIIDLKGNSVFSVYPALLLVPVLFCNRRYVDKKRISFLILAGIVIGLNILSLMLYFATGGNQFGYRYFFDVLPLIFLLFIFILPYISIFIQMGLLAYGVFINSYGVIAFYSVPTDNSQLQTTLFGIILLISIPYFFSIDSISQS